MTVKRKICFATYPSMLNTFKDKCENDWGTTVTEEISNLITQYIHGVIKPIAELKTYLVHAREKGETKNAPTTIRISTELYDKLLKKLKLDDNARPATCINLLMAYAIKRNQPIFYTDAQKARTFLNDCPKNITHVVYGYKTYKPAENADGFFQIAHTEYFIDACTEQRWEDYYQTTSPLIDVLAVHRQPSTHKGGA